MKKLIVLTVLLAGAGAWFFHNRLFASMPAMTITDSHLLVGTAPGDHALYALNAQCDIHAASLGYEFNSATLGDVLPKFGARGIISYMNPDKYKAIQTVAQRSNTCMANPLNDCQRNGEIQHMFLIPRDAAALSQMQHASIDAGHNFHLKGRYLTFQEGSLKGHPLNASFDGTGYFLVEAISPD